MKFPRITASAVAAAITFTGISLPAHAGSFSETVPDTALRKCITDKLEIDENAEPTAEQLATVDTLSCRDKGIRDLTGVAALPELVKLFVNNNQIEDLQPLASATKLFSLGLGGNQISDLSPLRSLTELRSVDVDNNRLADISVLGTLPQWTPIGGGTRHGQQATGTPVQAGSPVALPSVIGAKGNKVVPETSEQVSIANSMVTYPKAGSYRWRFRDETDLYFNGSITVEVSEASANTITDDALRACVNSRLKIADPDTHPTPEQLAGLSGSLNCSNKGVKNLTGIELMTGLTQLRLSRNEIADVTPIAALKELTSLDLAQNRVTSLSPLGVLPKLRTLQIQQSPSSADKPKLSSLAGIEGFPELTSLTVNYQGLTSLEPLAGHNKLSSLTASNNELTDVTALASLPALKTVNLDTNHISDLSALKDQNFRRLSVKDQQLTAAEVTAGQAAAAPAVTNQDGTKLIATPPAGVTVDGENVTYSEAGDFEWSFSNAKSPLPETFAGTITQHVLPAPPPVADVNLPDKNLRACLNTKYLNQAADAPISAQQLAGITAKVSCVGRKPREGQEDARIVDLTGAELLTGVQELQLASNKIVDLAPLSGLSQLTVLGVPTNEVTDLGPLAGLTNLTKLSVSYNPITSLAPLAKMSVLKDLEATQQNRSPYPGVNSLAGVESLTSLERLVVNNSQISDLTALTGLSNLKVFFVSSNQVKNIDALAGLVKMERLGLDYNQISDISALRSLTRLNTLSVQHNHIGDFSALKDSRPWGFNQPKLDRQSVIAPPVPAELAVNPPTIIGMDGQQIALTPPNGLSLVEGKVTYPVPGEYVWSWGRGAQRSTVTQPVGDAVPEAANIPDSRLRSCIAESAGLPKDAVPNVKQVAELESLTCTGAPIVDLTGIELLTGAKRLDLSDAGVSDVTKLSALTGLDELVLDNNSIADLAALQPLSAQLSARGQKLTLPDTAGGVAVAAPKVVDKAGQEVTANAPEGQELVGGKVTFKQQGNYIWPFTAMAGQFTGSFAQRVTSDAPVDPALFAFTDEDVAACVSAGKVFVIVDPVTVDMMGGCANKFGTGTEALTSAGFLINDGDFITTINGYRADYTLDKMWWAYYHRHQTSSRDSGQWGNWEFSDKLAGEYQPKPGSIEGWVITPAGASDPVKIPRWEPAPQQTPSPTPSQAPDPSPSPTMSPGPTAAPLPSEAPSANPTAQPQPGKPSDKASVAPTSDPAPRVSGKRPPSNTPGLPKTGN